LSPVYAVHRIAVRELEQELSTVQGKSDKDVAQILADLSLTQRLSEARSDELAQKFSVTSPDWHW